MKKIWKMEADVMEVEELPMSWINEKLENGIGKAFVYESYGKHYLSISSSNYETFIEIIEKVWCLSSGYSEEEWKKIVENKEFNYEEIE